MGPGIPLRIPCRPVELYRGEADRLGLAIYPKEDGRFPTIDVHTGDHAITPGPRQDEFVAADLPVLTATSPVLLETVNAICLVALRMLLPLRILIPEAVSLGQVAGLDCLQKDAHMVLFRPIPKPPCTEGA